MDEFFDVPDLEPTFKTHLGTFRGKVTAQVVPRIPREIPFGITLSEFVYQIIEATANVSVRMLATEEGKALLSSMHLLSVVDKKPTIVPDAIAGLSEQDLFKTKPIEPPPPPSGVEGSWVPKL